MRSSIRAVGHAERPIVPSRSTPACRIENVPPVDDAALRVRDGPEFHRVHGHELGPFGEHQYDPGVTPSLHHRPTVDKLRAHLPPTTHRYRVVNVPVLPPTIR